MQLRQDSRAETSVAVPPCREQRVEVRLVCPERPTLRLSPWAAFDDALVAVQDVSFCGICFLTSVPLEPGERVALLWDFGPMHQHRTLTAMVKHATRIRTRSFRAGCAFDAPLTPEDIEAIRTWRKRSREPRSGHGAGPAMPMAAAEKTGGT